MPGPGLHLRLGAAHCSGGIVGLAGRAAQTTQRLKDPTCGLAYLALNMHNSPYPLGPLLDKGLSFERAFEQ